MPSTGKSQRGTAKSSALSPVPSGSISLDLPESRPSSGLSAGDANEETGAGQQTSSGPATTEQSVQKSKASSKAVQPATAVSKKSVRFTEEPSIKETPAREDADDEDDVAFADFDDEDDEEEEEEEEVPGEPADKPLTNSGLKDMRPGQIGYILAHCPIRQGKHLEDSWLLSPALSFFRSPALIEKFARRVTKFCFLVRLFNYAAEWETVRVHVRDFPRPPGLDSVEVLANSADYLRYVEAAVAKFLNGFGNLAAATGDPVETFTLLTGGFAETFNFRTRNNEFDDFFSKDPVFERLIDEKTFFASLQTTRSNKPPHSCAIMQNERLPSAEYSRFFVVDPKVMSALDIPGDWNTLEEYHATTSFKAVQAATNDGQRVKLANKSGRLSQMTFGARQRKRLKFLLEQLLKYVRSFRLLERGFDVYGELTGWYGEPGIISNFDSVTICRPLINEDPKWVRSRLVQVLSAWTPGFNSGGSRADIMAYSKNPQFLLSLKLKDDIGFAKLDGKRPWLYVSLAQPYKLHKTGYHDLAFHVFQLDELWRSNGPAPVSPSFVLTKQELFSSLPHSQFSTIAKSFASIQRIANQSELYLLIVPSTFRPVGHRTEFMLRAFTEVGELTLQHAWRYDPRTMEVPWIVGFEDDAFDREKTETLGPQSHNRPIGKASTERVSPISLSHNSAEPERDSETENSPEPDGGSPTESSPAPISGSATKNSHTPGRGSVTESSPAPGKGSPEPPGYESPNSDTSEQ